MRFLGVFDNYTALYKKGSAAFDRLARRSRAVTATFVIITVPLTGSAGFSVLTGNGGHHIATLEGSLEKNIILGKKESLQLSFDTPIEDASAFNTQVLLHPPIATERVWNDTFTELTITPHKTWVTDTRYTLSFPRTQEPGDTTASLLEFSTSPRPQIVRVSPEKTNIPFVMQRGTELSFTFDRALHDFDVRLVSEPELAFDVETNYDHNNVRATLTAPAPSHGTYTFLVYLKDKDAPSSAYFPVGSFSFRSVPPAPDEWPEDHNERLVLAQNTTVPQVTSGRYIDVNINAQVTTLFDNGVFVANFIASSGTYNTPTPKGTFYIHDKHPRALSQMFGMYMPYWMAFTPDGKYGFHDLPIWPEGHPEVPEGGKESVASLGKQVSPGCVRHDAHDSKALYDWTAIGTPVVIY